MRSKKATLAPPPRSPVPPDPVGEVTELMRKVLDYIEKHRTPQQPKSAAVLKELLKRAAMGVPATPFGDERFGGPMRDKPLKSGRQDRFDELSRWSLGRDGKHEA